MKKIRLCWVGMISVAVFLLGIGGLSALTAEKVTLRYADSPYGPSLMEKQEEYIKKICEWYPNIEVKLERVSWEEWEDKLRIQAAAGDLPDVFFVWGPAARGWIKNAQLMELTPYIERDAELVDIDDFFPVALEPYRWRDGLYGLPMDMGPAGIHAYNVTLFNQAGLAYPTKEWTLEREFFDVLKKLTKDIDGDGKTDQWGWSGGPLIKGNWTIDMYLRPFGGGFVNDAETECLLTKPESIYALNWWTDLIFKHHVAPTPAEMAGYPWAGPMFGTDKVAMMSASSWTGLDLEGFTELKWDAMHAPRGPAGRYSPAMGSCYVIAKTTKHPEEAWIFLREYTGKEGLVEIWLESGSIARKSGWLTWEGVLTEPKNIHIFYEVMQEYAGLGRPISPVASEVGSIFNSEFELVFTQQKTVEEAVEAIKKKIDPLLAQNL